MDKSSYLAAMTAIQDADKENITKLADVIKVFSEALDTAKAAIADIEDGYPAMTGQAIGGKLVIDNTSAQLASCTYQVQSMTQSVAQALASYTPAPAFNPVVSPQA